MCPAWVPGAVWTVWSEAPLSLEGMSVPRLQVSKARDDGGELTPCVQGPRHGQASGQRPQEDDEGSQEADG